MNPRWRLVLAAGVFLGWMSWLSYAALTKSRGPIVSHAQAAAAKHQVVAEVTARDDGKPSGSVTVVESLTADGPAAGTEILVGNLPLAVGFDGPGRYLLLLSGRPYTLVSQPHSPGNGSSSVDSLLVYRWGEDVRKQAERLRR